MAQTTSTAEDHAIATLVRLLEFDPWSLTVAERSDLRQAYSAHQRTWLPRLNGLVEPPAIDATFPAFLLGTPTFADLAQGIGNARAPHELDTATADRLQRFVDRYRGYLVA